MATVIVIDESGHERMRRNTNETVLPPPPGWDEAKWTGNVVTDLIRTLDREEAEAAANRPSIVKVSTPNDQFVYGPYEAKIAEQLAAIITNDDEAFPDQEAEAEHLVLLSDAGYEDEGVIING